MRVRPILLAAVAAPAVLLSSLFAACGGEGESTSFGTTGTTSGAGGDGGPSDAAGGGAPSLIYAHTDTTLFTLDPTSAMPTLTPVGDFDCIGNDAGPLEQSSSMTDVAVDRAGNLWGLSAVAVRPLTIQGKAVHCEQLTSLKVPDPKKPGDYVSFYSLSFAPVGVIDPSQEILVAGNMAGQLWTLKEGKFEQHGRLGVIPPDDGHGHLYKNPGKDWALSGDIVFLDNGKSPVGFAAVRDCSDPTDSQTCESGNVLLEIDLGKLKAPGTQEVKKRILGQIEKPAAGCADGITSYGSMYGLATWNEKLFGFSRSGYLVGINLADGATCLIKEYPNEKFAGAGVTTLAPITPPM